MADASAAPESRGPLPGSRVLAVPAAEPGRALDYFLRVRLSCETDPYDVHHDLSEGATGFLLLDARQEAAHREESLPGALSVPHTTMTDERLAALDPGPVYVTFGWGPACNAGTKAAARLASAGFRVKEMIGGLEYWKSQNYPTKPKGE
ncbi:rhodanese-like domain-containing protein [Streptomyces sp. NBC_01216]|uniref:rhodanese-like domain-containing protein n=1 Tax=unclassified Streptomyces TaxID=2593676 RepID=UPI002E13657B|nr:rhodanese-like domain-containing protein [Streptomyces sp. NBC_01216]